jgi:hypothetical protein
VLDTADQERERCNLHGEGGAASFGEVTQVRARFPA